MNSSKWVICPLCRGKTRIKIRSDTSIRRLPLYCPKCKQESLVDIKNLKIILIREPEEISQSQ
ncbi:cysteine-rich KTR domain-containing protein [Enterococcus sp. AZ196]|uniref:cysteine-rich KTR domain-containing protein n=1 Tax=Enterococcus sp. AZ196 TaxID=2774659 RepID=UPI003D28EEE8